MAEEEYCRAGVPRRLGSFSVRYHAYKYINIEISTATYRYLLLHNGDALLGVIHDPLSHTVGGTGPPIGDHVLLQRFRALRHGAEELLHCLPTAVLLLSLQRLTEVCHRRRGRGWCLGGILGETAKP